MCEPIFGNGEHAVTDPLLIVLLLPASQLPLAGRYESQAGHLIKFNESGLFVNGRRGDDSPYRKKLHHMHRHSDPLRPTLTVRS